MKIYVAHQISGLKSEEVIDYYEEIKIKLGAMGYTVLCPMTAKGYFRNLPNEVYKQQGYTFPPSTNHAIFERDKWMVANCDVWYCDFTGTTKVSTGIMFELAWASLLGKHTISVIPDGNIHQHAFVLEASDIIYPNTESSLDYLWYLIEGKI